jgi:hypothetical protein
MESMVQEEILTLTLIMEEIIVDLFNKVKENFKLVHSIHKDHSDKNLLLFKENHSITLEMEQEEIVI